MKTGNRLKKFALVAVTAAAPTVLLLGGATGTAHAGCVDMPAWLGQGGCIPEPADSPKLPVCGDVPAWWPGGCFAPGTFGPREPMAPGEPYPVLH